MRVVLLPFSFGCEGELGSGDDSVVPQSLKVDEEFAGDLLGERVGQQVYGLPPGGQVAEYYVVGAAALNARIHTTIAVLVRIRIVLSSERFAGRRGHSVGPATR